MEVWSNGAGLAKDLSLSHHHLNLPSSHNRPCDRYYLILAAPTRV